MFPLKNREVGGYRFGQRTWYTNRHVGVDYKAHYEPLMAPFDGEIVATVRGSQGGKTVHFRPKHDNVVMRFMHLDSFNVKPGDRVKKGQVIGTTGNSGGETTNPHLHIDISRKNVNITDFKNFIDPESYDWTGPVEFPIRIKTAFLLNQPQWPDFTSRVTRLCEWFKTASNGRIELDPYPLITNASGWPIIKNPDVNWAPMIRPDWFTNYIQPLAGDAKAIVFIPKNADWDGTSNDNLDLQGYCDHFVTKPIRIVIAVDSDEMSQHFPQEDAFFDYSRHELLHGLYKNGHPSKFDLVHRHFFEEHKPEACFDDLDYALLSQNLS